MVQSPSHLYPRLSDDSHTSSQRPANSRWYYSVHNPILFAYFLVQMFFTAGIVLNEGVNMIIKHVIKEPRPQNGYLAIYVYHYIIIMSYVIHCYADIHPRHLFGRYGMPSSHAQFMACFATYFTLFIFMKCVSEREREGGWEGGSVCLPTMFLSSIGLCYQ